MPLNLKHHGGLIYENNFSPLSLFIMDKLLRQTDIVDRNYNPIMIDVYNTQYIAIFHIYHHNIATYFTNKTYWLVTFYDYARVF